MRSRIAALLAVSLASCSQSEPPWARSPTPGLAGEPTIAGTPAPVVAFKVPPTIDGRLDESEWSAAQPLGPLVDPGTGAATSASPVQAFARLGWDAQKLYLGIVVRDREPISPFQRRDVDPHIWERSSAVEIMLQPGDFKDNRDYYEIQVDVAGAVFDTHWDDYNHPISGTQTDRVYGHMDWSSQAERAVFQKPGAFYSVEVAIPWKALLPGRTAIPPQRGEVWRLNLYSFRDGQAQSLAWSPLRGQGNFHKSSRWGRIAFE
jgi:hypothetical protein